MILNSKEHNTRVNIMNGAEASEELDFSFNNDLERILEPVDDFVLEETENENSTSDAWKVLVVDDEKDIHTVVKLALHGFNFRGRSLQFIDAYSAEEAQQYLEHHKDIALLLLDVVMESEQAGLELVRFIRNQLNNEFIRIVLWTGQPGQAPEKEVILQYEINDYRTKTELTSDKLFTVVLSGLRNYEAINTIENYRQHLEAKVLERTAELRDKQNELEQQRNQLEKLNATKDKFFRIISHDLKNPFAAILSISESMITSFDDLERDELKYGLSKIKNSSCRLYELLQNLLQWAKAQNGTIPYHPIQVELYDLIESEIALASIHAERKNITTTISLQKGTTVFADPNTVRTVFRNIYSNALKFSKTDGMIEVQQKDCGNCWEISILDEGVGMSGEDLEKLFKVDSYFSKKGTANESGSGLGLLICLELIEQNGGKLSVHSRLGEGSEFRFSLPKHQ